MEVVKNLKSEIVRPKQLWFSSALKVVDARWSHLPTKGSKKIPTENSKSSLDQVAGLLKHQKSWKI